MGKQRDELRAQQNEEQRRIAEWYYEQTRTPEVGVMLLGMMETLATDHPAWTWWRIAEVVRQQFIRLKPLADAAVQELKKIKGQV